MTYVAPCDFCNISCGTNHWLNSCLYHSYCSVSMFSSIWLQGRKSETGRWCHWQWRTSRSLPSGSVGDHSQLPMGLHGCLHCMQTTQLRQLRETWVGAHVIMYCELSQTDTTFPPWLSTIEPIVYTSAAATFGDGDQLQVVSGVQCLGWENALTDCTSSSYGDFTLSRSFTAGILCFDGE